MAVNVDDKIRKRNPSRLQAIVTDHFEAPWGTRVKVLTVVALAILGFTFHIFSQFTPTPDGLGI